MKHITCLCAGTLLACLALSNAYASTPRHFLPYTADVSVPAHSAGSENPLVADRDNGQHWDNRDRKDSKWNDRDRDHPGRKHDKDRLERERRKDHQYNRHPQPRHDDGQYRPEELKRRGFDDGQYHPGR